MRDLSGTFLRQTDLPCFEIFLPRLRLGRFYRLRVSPLQDLSRHAFFSSLRFHTHSHTSKANFGFNKNGGSHYYYHNCSKVPLTFEMSIALLKRSNLLTTAQRQNAQVSTQKETVGDFTNHSQDRNAVESEYVY